MSNSRPNRELLLIFILGSLTAIGPLSIDMYLPTFSQIADTLQTDISNIAYSLSSFFVGLAVGQLIYGPLLERFGRKRPVYAGLVIYILASFGCAMAVSIEQLIAFRFLQAIGGCAGMVASRAIIRDLFDGKKVAKVFATLIMVIAISPILAPSVGGLLSIYFGWRAIFLVLLGLSVMMFLGAYFVLPETKNPDPSFSLNPGKIFGSYVSIFKNPFFFVNTFTGAIAYAGLYAYLSGAPQLYMEILGLNEQQFGWIFAIIASGLIAATQVNNFLLRSMSSEQLVLVALIGHFFVGLIMLSVTLLGITGLFIDTAMIFGFLLFVGFILPNASALALAPMKHIAGNASALMGSIQMAVGAGASFLVGFFQTDTPLPMIMVMTICAGGSLALFYFGGKYLANIETEEKQLAEVS